MKINFSYETINKTFDGRQINIIIYVSVVPGHEEDLSKVLVSIIDISDIKKAEEELQKKNLLQEKVVALGRELAALLDISAIYETAERYVKSMVDCPDYAIILYDSDRKILTPSYLSTEGKNINPLLCKPINYEIGCSECGYSQAIDSKSPVIRDLLVKSQTNIWPSTIEERIRKSVIYIPILAEDQVLGLIELQSSLENAYSAEIGDWLSVVANQIGLAIQNARLHDDHLLELAERRKPRMKSGRAWLRLELLYNNAQPVNPDA
jgi:GAF domain-containing protein